jgi:hypothetical protein
MKNLKRFLGTSIALGALVSAMSVTGVFAAEPTFVVGNPIDALTGEEVTEFKAGQIIEVPVDITNVDSGKLSGVQMEMYYDSSVFTPGIDATEEGTDGDTYYNSYTENLLAMDPTDLNKEVYRVVGRNNIQGKGSKGNISGNCYADPDGVTLMWTTAGTSNAISASVPEYYFAFTVKDDYVAPETLNYAGTQSYTSTGLFALNVIKASETTSTPHTNLTGTQTSAKLNACDGAFQIVINSTDLPYYVKSIKANDTELTACTNEDGTTTYKFPVRLISSTGSASGTTDVAITAVVSDDEAGSVNSREVSWGKVTVNVDGTATSYADTSVTYNE